MTTPQLPHSDGASQQARVQAAVQEAQRLYRGRPDVRAVEAGWKFRGGWITDQRAVVFAVPQKLGAQALHAAGLEPLPAEVLGVPTDVRPATPDDLGLRQAALEARAWQSSYTPPPDAAALLAEVHADMTVTLHASPDAGFVVLSDFLGGVKTRLTLGMYDFTAPHIVQALLAGLGSAASLQLVLQQGEDIGQGTKAQDWPESQVVQTLQDALHARFRMVWADVRGPGSAFKSAYHIKVAVRDSDSFWLSSGNWQSSNQPNTDPLHGPDTQPPLLTAYNREWHAVVQHAGLAHTFERFLQHDFERAQAAHPAPPSPQLWVAQSSLEARAARTAAPHYTAPKILKKRLRVQPVLTPDNYGPHVLDLIHAAKKRLYFQNQSLSILAQNPPHFQALLSALLARQQEGLDVRLIIRDIGDVRRTVSAARDFGFDTGRLRLQVGCHTKGLICDGQAVLLGSQNWTGDGTGFNRDASLILHDAEAAGYFERLFLYDWERALPPHIDETHPAPQPVLPGDPAARPGWRRVPLPSWEGEG